MKLELFTGIGTLAFGVVFDSFAACVVGTFFVLLVAVDVVPRWIRHEITTWRRVVRHEAAHPVDHDAARRRAA